MLQCLQNFTSISKYATRISIFYMNLQLQFFSDNHKGHWKNYSMCTYKTKLAMEQDRYMLYVTLLST
jgi:hypothetical protein